MVQENPASSAGKPMRATHLVLFYSWLLEKTADILFYLFYYQISCFRLRLEKMTQEFYANPGAHQMEPPSPLISWVNPFRSRFINRTACFPREVGCFRESRMSSWKNKVGWSRTQKPVLRPFSFSYLMGSWHDRKFMKLYQFAFVQKCPTQVTLSGGKVNMSTAS